jgi:hypothetical protein
MWSGPDAELWLPPVPAGTLIGLELRPAPGGHPLVVTVDHGGGGVEIAGDAGATRWWTRTTDTADGPVIVRFDRADAYPPGESDERPLSAQLLDLVVRPPGARWRGPAATPAERASLRLELAGCYGPEIFPEHGRGVWLEPDATLRLEIDEPGVVDLRLAAPRPVPADPRAVVDGELVAGPLELGAGPAMLTIPVDDRAAAAGVVEITVISEPYRPAAAGNGTDSRELGVVLLGAGFTPAEPSDGWWNAGS